MNKANKRLQFLIYIILIVILFWFIFGLAMYWHT